MRQTNTRTVAEQKPLGVIDVVTAGLDLVRRRPWTLLIPVLFDTIIWLVPRLSLAQLIRPYSDQVLSALALSSDPDTMEQARASVTQFINSFNLLSFVAAALNAVTRLPSLFATRPDWVFGLDSSTVTSPINAWAFASPLSSPSLIVLLFIPLFLLGLLGMSVYLEWIAQGVRPLEQETRGMWVLRAARLWLRLILFSVFLAVLALAAELIFGFVEFALNVPELAVLLSLVVLVGVIWIFIYFFFIPSALAVSDVSVRQALRRSMLLFRAFFWPTLALVALCVLLDRGLALIWNGLTVSPFGVAIAIVANAYVGTSLIAASMVYYQDRLSAFERMRQAAKQIKPVKPVKPAKK